MRCMDLQPNGRLRYICRMPLWSMRLRTRSNTALHHATAARRWVPWPHQLREISQRMRCIPRCIVCAHDRAQPCLMQPTVYAHGRASPAACDCGMCLGALRGQARTVVVGRPCAWPRQKLACSGGELSRHESVVRGEAVGTSVQFRRHVLVRRHVAMLPQHRALTTPPRAIPCTDHTLGPNREPVA